MTRALGTPQRGQTIPEVERLAIGFLLANPFRLRTRHVRYTNCSARPAFAVSFLVSDVFAPIRCSQDNRPANCGRKRGSTAEVRAADSIIFRSRRARAASIGAWPNAQIHTSWKSPCLLFPWKLDFFRGSSTIAVLRDIGSAILSSPAPPRRRPPT